MPKIIIVNKNQMNKWLVIILFLLGSCHSRTDVKIFSLAILINNPESYESENYGEKSLDYESYFVCHRYYELKDDSLFTYSQTRKGRFQYKKVVSESFCRNFISIVQGTLSLKHRGRFKDTINNRDNRVYCGYFYVPRIRGKHSSIKLVAESLPEHIQKQLDELDKTHDKHKIELNRDNFPEGVLFSEQYVNLQFPLPISLPVRPINR